MAEAALFGLASKLLSTIETLESGKPNQKIPLAKDHKKLKASIREIHDVLLDAERQQESSAAVKRWIKQVGDALYDAEDLFDELLTALELKRQIGNQVLDFLSPSNLFPYITKVYGRLRALSTSLDRISKESTVFCFKEIRGEGETTAVSEGGSYVDLNVVVGREIDKGVIVDYLLKDTNVEKNVIAIVGIGGMGKTRLAQLVYNDERIKRNFESRWWASISDVHKDTEILRRICKAIGVEKTHELKDDKLESRIENSVGRGGKYLLVIDGVRDDNHTKWSNRKKLLFNGSQGCRIIITTRSSSAAKAMEATKTHMLCGLSDDESCQLFEAMAITQEKQGDPVWGDRGREIATKCSGVPLAIKGLAMLLREKKDWESFMKVELSKVALSENLILSVLKLSYDQLSSGLKQCFAYCSLFPKYHVISKHKLLYLWVAQGYINPVSDEQTFEEVGDAYFKKLVSLHFLQKAEEDEVGEIEHYKMHDLVHDLAQHVAGDQTAILTPHSNHVQGARHVSVCYDTSQSSEILPQLLSDDRLRSCVFMTTDSRRSSPFAPQQLTKFRLLRALDLSELDIKDVPDSIGDFKYLRYLNLSRNPFESLPDSIFKLPNLITLDISWCLSLKAWPKNFRRLTNLRHLDYSHCPGLKQKLDGFGEQSLQHLSGRCKSNELEELSRMLKPKGKLRIEFGADLDGDVQSWQLPATIQVLEICSYPGESLPSWNHDINKSTAAIVRLELHCCENLKRLPALRILPNLKTLVVNGSKMLEFVEEDDAETTSSSTFPCLEKLSLIQLPKLKGWTSKENKLEGGIFQHLKELEIVECPSWDIWGDSNVDHGMDWGSLSSLRNLRISPMPSPDKLPECLEQRKVRVMEGSPPRIEEDKVTRSTPEGSTPRTHEKDEVSPNCFPSRSQSSKGKPTSS